MQTVLLYYKFIKIDDPKNLRDSQYELCQGLGIKGRILIGYEGINGTVAGTRSACEKYMSETEKVVGSVEWKISEASDDTIFPKLKVKVRNEIVTFGFQTDLSKTAPYIEPEELKYLYKNNENFLILDGRNEYEGRIGKFKNAVVPDIDNFRDFPEWFKQNKNMFKGKKVVTYCTGGIRCEKLSAFLVENGVGDVVQLHGGIHRYAEETGGENFDGEMYVFDSRVHVPVNSVNPEVISECIHCQTKVARFRNCKNVVCNKQIIICSECESNMQGCCSEQCVMSVNSKFESTKDLNQNFINSDL